MISNIKDALEYALHAFEHLHNTQTYQGDNQDFSDEIITMRAALAELDQALLNTCLSNAKQEPAQSELLEVVLAMRDWIDAVPQDTQLPAMPGFDRDWANAVIEQAQKSEPAQAVPAEDSYLDQCLDQRMAAIESAAPLDSKQAVPVAWRWLRNGKPDSDKCFPMPGPDADKIEAVSAKAYPVTVQYFYAASTAPLDSDTRKMVLELCRLIILNGAVDGIITAAMEEMAAKICDRLEVGE